QLRSYGASDAARGPGHYCYAIDLTVHLALPSYDMDAVSITVEMLASRFHMNKASRYEVIAMVDEETTKRGRGRRPADKVRSDVLAAAGRLLLDDGLAAVTFS